MSNILSENERRYIRDCGKIIAPLYYNFAHYIKKNARYPIMVSYRSAIPIEHALKYINVPHNALWINREIAEAPSPKIRDYCLTQHLDKPFTFVDNGYIGSIPSSLKKVFAPPAMQSILLTDFDKSFGDANYFFGSSKNPNAKHHSNFWLGEITESLPNKYEEYGVEIFNYTQKHKIIIKPRHQPKRKKCIFNEFLTGMNSGFKSCKNISEDETAINEYMSMLANVMKLIRLVNDQENVTKSTRNQIANTAREVTHTF